MLGLVNTYILKQVIKISDLQLGLLQSIMMIAMFISPFICSYISKKLKITSILYWDNFIIGLTILVIAFISSPLYINQFSNNVGPYISMTVTYSFIALLSGINSILLGTILQQETPSLMIGRVSSVLNTLLVIATPLGQMVFGVLLDKAPVYICVSIISAIVIVSSIIFKILNKSSLQQLDVVISDENN